MTDGDSNTRYFHISIVIHRQNNEIAHFKLSDGTWSSNYDNIGDEFVTYFSNLFTSTAPMFPCNLNGLISGSVSTLDNSLLYCIPDHEEIRRTIFSMNSFKSPGLYGFSPLFFKTYWNIIHSSMVKDVQFVFTTSHILREMNHAFIVLIPKTSGLLE